METQHTSPKDPILWETAKKRAGFKISLLTYICVHLFFTAIWFFTGGGYFWPMWSLLGWGIGLFFQYWGAYKKAGAFSVEKEYDRLKSKEN